MRWLTSKGEIKSPAGVHYERNGPHLQKYEEEKSQAETTPSNPNETAVKDQETVRRRRREFQLNVMH